MQTALGRDDAVEVGDATLRGRLLVPVLVSIGMVVAIVSSLGSPMVPTVAREYGVSLSAAQWTLTIALLAGAVVTPVLGRLGDGRYRREVILAALALIALGGLLAAGSSAFALLLAGRALQGTGLGLMPMAMAVARDHLPAARIGPTIAVLSVTTAAGVGIGYPISGYLAQNVGYHETFVFAAVIAGLALAGAAWTIPRSSHRGHEPVDLVGAAVLAVGVSTLVIALSQVSDWGATSPTFLACLAIAAAAVGAWVSHELRSPRPLIDLRTLTNPSVRVAQATAVLVGVGMYFLISLAIRYVQTPESTGYGQGRSVLVAGLVLVPFSIASLAANRVAPLLRRWPGAAWMMPLGALAFIAGLVEFAAARSTVWELLVMMALAGVGVGVVLAAMPQMIVSVVPPDQTGSALGFNQVLRTLGSSIGSAASAAVLAAHTLPAEAFPSDSGYTVSAMIGMGVWLVMMVVAWPRRSLAGAVVDEGTMAATEAECVGAGTAGVIIYEPDPGPIERGASDERRRHD